MQLVSNFYVILTLKEARFDSFEATKKKTARVLKDLTEEDFQHCFELWKINMERCREVDIVEIAQNRVCRIGNKLVTT